MLTAIMTSLLLAAAPANPYADLLEPALDSNVAYFEGQTHSYVLSAPNGFRLVIDEARRDGYSAALVPEEQDYRDAGVSIALTYLTDSNEEPVPFEGVLKEDTASIREYYGPFTRIWPVDSMFNARSEIVPTVYVNNDSSFIPTVMVSYYDGGTEMLIIELLISETQPRFEAERYFEQALLRFKILKNASPEAAEQIGVATPEP